MARVGKKTKGGWRSEARSDPAAVKALVRLGKRIRAIRQEQELSLEEAAEGAKLSPQHLLDIEHGRTNPTVTSLFGIARALDASLRDLFDED